IREMKKVINGAFCKTLRYLVINLLLVYPKVGISIHTVFMYIQAIQFLRCRDPYTGNFMDGLENNECHERTKCAYYDHSAQLVEKLDKSGFFSKNTYGQGAAYSTDQVYGNGSYGIVQF